MTDRPYIGKSIIELEAIFAVGSTDSAELKRLSKELKHRKVPKAVRLLARVKEAIESQESPQQEYTANQTRRTATHSNDEPTHKNILCEVCRQELRVPLASGNGTCRSCKSKFKAIFEDGVFTLVFVHPAKENEPPKSSDGEPITLSDAYALFEANQATSWEAIESKRRTLLQQYHPDKVASLGPKLRAVAEVEGKRINVAYALIRKVRGY